MVICIEIMGGHALKNTFTRRYEAMEFHVLSNEISMLIADSNKFLKFYIFKGWKHKTSFGDLDSLILPKDGTNVKEFIEKTFNPNEVVKNGSCISFDYKELQIDFIISEPENWDTQKAYLLYGDLGNLVGRLYNANFGLKYGHAGLSFTVKDENNNQVYGDWIVSKNIQKIFENIGLNWDKFMEGFNSKEEVYDYIISSKYFNPSIFDYEELNHINRTRNQKREFYSSFLEYIKDFPKYPTSKPKATDALEYVQNIWGGLENDEDHSLLIDRYNRLINGHRLRQYAKQRVVDIVRSYGFEHKELGEKMALLSEWITENANNIFSLEQKALEHEVSSRILPQNV